MKMTRHVSLSFLVFLHQSLCKASPLRRAPASSILQDLSQDLSKTVVTKTVVTTITTQTQETKTVVTKEKPAEDTDVSRFDTDSSVRQSVLPVPEGSTSLAEVMASLRRAAPREELETIRFPSSPSAYFRKESHGDSGVFEDNVSEPSQSEHAPHASDVSFIDLQENHSLKDAHEVHHLAQGKDETSSESKQDHVDPQKTWDAKMVDPQKQWDAKMGRWQSFLTTSAGSQDMMLPAAFRLLFFLVGLVIVLLAACGCASAALLA